MRARTSLWLLIVTVALTSVAGIAASQSPSSGTMAGEHVKKPRARRMPVVPVGVRDSSKWSATTYEAASAAEHRKMLASGRRVHVTGEVIDASCYLQLGKHGAAHVDCATKCANNGQPLGLLTKSHMLYFLFPEEHHPRRDGQAEIRTKMIPLMGKTVTVTGTATTVGGSHGLFLQAGDLENLKEAAGK